MLLPKITKYEAVNAEQNTAKNSECTMVKSHLVYMVLVCSMFNQLQISLLLAVEPFFGKSGYRYRYRKRCGKILTMAFKVVDECCEFE